MKNKILYILPASNKVGYGHLLRSSALAKKFKDLHFENILLGPKKNQIKYINRNIYNKIITLDLKQKKISSKIFEIYERNKCNYMVLDIPNFSTKEQESLNKKKIRWLHFDCANPVITYSNQKICSLPRNTKSKTKYLYTGINNSILRKEFFEKKKIKTSSKDIFISFGGGIDNGAFYFLLKNFQTFLKEYNLNILLGKNRFKSKIMKLLKKEYTLNKISFVKKNAKSIVNAIDKSLFSISSGGSITHEIFSRSKKMVIISIVKNQLLQSKLWQKEGNIYLGDISQKRKLKTLFYDNLKLMKKFRSKKFIIKKNPINQICKDTIEIIKKK